MDTGVKISIIAAVAENGVIGKDGDIPWRLRNDLRRFALLTKGHTVIVGRKTHEAILRRLGHPLERRRTIVVTRQQRYESECEVVHSLEEAIQRAASSEEVFVIGGSELYRAALPYADRLYLTRVHAMVPGDAFLEFDVAKDWKLVHEEPHPRDLENEFDYTFKVYERWVSSQKSFVNLEAARHGDQRAVMERLASDGVCPFCPENRTAGEVLEPLWRGKHWVLVPNRWPYKFTKLHLMAIPGRHVRFPHELGLEEWVELHEVLALAITAHGIKGGSIGMRFGDPAMTGASVGHLHLQIIVADQNVRQPGYERVRFPMGPKPKSEEKKSPGS